MAPRVAAAALVAALSCAAIACDWPWRHDMVDQPSRPAGAGPRPAPPGTMPIDGVPALSRDAAERLLQNPVPSSAPTEPGRRLYSVYCAPCHGMSGKGDGPVAPLFAPSMRDLTSDEIQRHADGWLYATITNGTANMPRSAHEMEPRERWEVVHFVRTLARPAP